MDNYIVSARKYRPITFDTVVGQHGLTTTLKNAIATNKLAHAYLFCGPRGVGKTTCARIFAKTINCLTPTANGEACDTCESCQSFNEQRSYNIHELDAASNNSVDDIRTLIEQVQVPPQVGKYKVYIIDEVHMLSTAAFNAFLKTLEEPPHYAIFILATTEKHKILPTILSRCQTYDFTRITLADIEQHLASVAEKEGIRYEPEALGVIALKADGGMRDALSIFDQVASFTGGNITYQAAIDNLNVLDYEYYFRLTDMFLQRDIKGSLLLLDEVLRRGFDAGHFMTGLSSHFRDLLVSRDETTIPLLQVGQTTAERYKTQAQQCTLPFLYGAMRLCNDCDLSYRASKNKRLHVELTLIQVAQLLDEAADGVGGRSPKKVLAPVFSEKATTAVQGAVSTATPTPATTTAVAQSVVASSTVPPATPTPVPTAGNKTVTKKGMTFGPSIHRTVETPASAPSMQVAEPQVTYGTEEDQPVQSEKMLLYWREFAYSLPREESHNTARLNNAAPALAPDGHTIQLSVENAMAHDDLQKLRPRLESYLRERLHNSKVSIQIEVSQSTERTKAYTEKEKYALMLEKNQALGKLQEVLDLRLI